MDKLIFIIPILYTTLWSIFVNLLNTLSIQYNITNLYLWIKNFHFTLSLTIISSIFFTLYFVKGHQYWMNYVSLTLLQIGIWLIITVLFSYFKIWEIITWQKLLWILIVMLWVYISTLK